MPARLYRISSLSDLDIVKPHDTILGAEIMAASGVDVMYLSNVPTLRPLAAVDPTSVIKSAVLIDEPVSLIYLICRD